MKKYTCSALLCSALLITSSLYADDNNQKDELINKISKPDDSQQIKSLEPLGPLGSQLKQLSEKFGQNKEKFQTILLDNLNEAGPNSSGMDSQEVKDAYKNNFSKEDLQSILDLRKNETWLKTNNPQYQAYVINKAMNRMLGSSMPRFMISFLKQIATKTPDNQNISNKLLDFFQKEIDHPNNSDMLNTMRTEYNQEIKQNTLPKASDGVTPEKIALAGEYMSHLYSPDQMIGPIVKIITIILKVENQTDAEKKLFSNIIDAFMNHKENTLLNQFYIDTFIKANEKVMAETFTLQELKEMLSFQNQPLVKKLNEFNRNILSQAFMKGLKEDISNNKGSAKNPDSFVRNAVNKTLKKAKEMNLISEEDLDNIQKEVSNIKM